MSFVWIVVRVVAVAAAAAVYFRLALLSTGSDNLSATRSSQIRAPHMNVHLSPLLHCNERPLVLPQ